MKIINIGLVSVIAILSSCGYKAKNPDVKSKVASDTLKYHYENLKKRADDCGNKPDSSCTVISIKYPVFNNQQILSDTVKHWAVDTNFEVFTKQFLKSYELDIAKTKRKVSYTYSSTVSVIRQDSALATLQLDRYNFTGGAHGSSYTGFLNWDIKTDKKILVKDILIDGYLPELTKVADSIFRKQENLTATSSLANDYFFKGGKFALNNNVLISPLGLRFLYNQYEIKPYAAGTTDLLVPYSKIKSLIKPHTVIAQYIK